MSRWPGGRWYASWRSGTPKRGGGPGFRPAGLPFLPRPLHRRLLRIFAVGAGELGGLHAPTSALSAAGLSLRLLPHRRVGGPRPHPAKRRRPGHGNPGMANLAHELGKGWGSVVLAGDIAKTALAFGLCRALFPALGPVRPVGRAGVRCWATISPSAGLPGQRSGGRLPAPPSSSSPPYGGRPPVCPDWPSPCLLAGCPGGRWG